MSPRLKVFDLVIQRLAKLEEGSSGFLLGTSSEDSVHVLGIVKHLETTESDSDEPNHSDITSNLPANFGFCGAFHVQKGEQPSSINVDLCKTSHDTSVIIVYDLSCEKISCSFYEDGEVRKAEHTIVSAEDLKKSFLILKLTATIPLSCDFQPEIVKETFESIHQKIDDGNAAFHILGSEIYILGNKSSDVSGISSESTLDEVFSVVRSNQGNKNKSEIRVLDVSLYLKGTKSNTSPQLAPLIKYVKKEYKHVEIQLAVDSLAYVSNEVKAKELHSILVESLSRNLILNEKSLLSQLSSSRILDVSLPKTYHFFPADCGHFLSIVYPAKQTPEQLKKTRENFHLLLSLPLDKPLFRQANSFEFSMKEEDSSKNLILNPHEGLAKSGVPEGEPCTVQGTYAYHHYMQDNIDDNGWGCAYRSLQTICSWFRFQGYTNLPVPSHKEIQQCLVNIGDKPSSFVGSKQWIGSTEVSFVLDTLLGVTCRIVNVSSGEEMTMKGGELSYHFKTQGTPVMIGGGVLAHTILGVDYNKKTGAIKFLILDPHYTGSEDLKVIQSKGWCGWKGPEFWKKDAFYNMCFPLKPKCV